MPPLNEPDNQKRDGQDQEIRNAHWRVLLEYLSSLFLEAFSVS